MVGRVSLPSDARRANTNSHPSAPSALILVSNAESGIEIMRYSHSCEGRTPLNRDWKNGNANSARISKTMMTVPWPEPMPRKVAYGGAATCRYGDGSGSVGDVEVDAGFGAGSGGFGGSARGLGTGTSIISLQAGHSISWVANSSGASSV